MFAFGGPILVLPELLPDAARPGVVVVAVGALVLAVALLRSSRGVRFATGALGLASLSGYLVAEGSQGALSHFTGLAFGLFWMAALTYWCTSEARLRAATTLMALGGVGILLAAMVGADVRMLYGMDVRSWFPPTSLGLPGLPASGLVNQNALAAAVLLLVPLGPVLLCLPGQAGGGSSGLRFIGGLLTAVSGLGLVLADSRTAWVTVWLTLAVMVQYSRWPAPRRARWLLGLVGLPVLAASALWAGNSGLRDRMTASATFSVERRFEIWGQAADELATAPWLGIGLNRFRDVYDPPFQASPSFDIAHAHNIFVQTALDVGFVGLGAYVALIALLLARAARAAHGTSPFAARIAVAGGLVLVGAHIFGLGDAVSLGAKVGLFQWWASGLVLAAWQVQERIRLS